MQQEKGSLRKGLKQPRQKKPDRNLVRKNDNERGLREIFLFYLNSVERLESEFNLITESHT
jgi:hypothetical protein